MCTLFIVGRVGEPFGNEELRGEISFNFLRLEQVAALQIGLFVRVKVEATSANSIMLKHTEVSFAVLIIPTLS